MKTIKTLLIAVFVLLCSTMASAHNFEVDGIYYNIISWSGLTVEVTHKGTNPNYYEEYSGKVIIPTTVTYNAETYSVTSIGDNAFCRCTGLTSVTIPNSVTTIESGAFYNCTSLKEVHISDLAAWCKIDFENYSSNPLYYAHNHYLNGELVTDLVIPDNVTKIKDYAFYRCTGLTSITIPNSVTTIGDYAFYDCTGLTSVTIPNSVTTIGRYAFSGCTGLTSVTIPNSVTTIGSSAFYDCTGLKSVYNFSSLTLTAGSSANGYVAYYADKVINAPNGSIEVDYVFGIINGINTLCGYIGNGGDIVLPTDYKGEDYVIGANIFKDEKAITSVAIQGGVTDIGENAFYGCSGLACVTIGNGVTSIEECAFEGCSGLTNVTIGNGVTSIEERAFQGCSSLKSISIPGNVKSTGRAAFYNCTGLKNVDITDGVTSIGEAAFSGCAGIESLYISNSIENIGDNAFAGCNNILDIKVGSKKAIVANENIFSDDAYNNACLYVPTGRKFAYEKTAPWNKFYTIEMDFTGITEISPDDAEPLGNGVIFDLYGRPVNEPAKGGIYIIDGKKVVL